MHVELTYFRVATGEHVGGGHFETRSSLLDSVRSEVIEKRALGMLPGLRPRQGHQFVIHVRAGEHKPMLLMPTRVDDDDVTPPPVSP